MLFRSHRSDLSGFVFDEKSAQGRSVHFVTRVFNQHSVIVTDLLGDVSKKWEIKLTETAFSSWGFYPSEVSKVRVSTYPQDISSELLKLWLGIRKSNELGRAHVCEIKRVEQHY